MKEQKYKLRTYKTNIKVDEKLLEKQDGFIKYLVKEIKNKKVNR